MQAEYATADGEPADPPAAGEPPDPAGDGLPPLPHAAASSARAAAAMIAATVRGGRGHARRGRRRTQVGSVIMPSAGARRSAATSGVARGAMTPPLFRLAHDRSRTVIVTPMSSGQAHNVHVRVLVVEDH